MEQHTSLDDKLDFSISELSIDEREQEKLGNLLLLLKYKHLPTLYHSLRVAERGKRFAQALGLNPKPAWYAGNLHDIGNMLIEKEILDKSEGINKLDLERIHMHPVYGYYLLRDLFPFSAEIVLRHHTHQRNPYPISFPEQKAKFSEKALNQATKYSAIIALAEFCDSIYFGKRDSPKKEPSQRSVRYRLIENFPKQERDIRRLYKEGLLSKN